MSDRLITVLLVENDPADARRVREGLLDTKHCAFRIEWVTRISDAIDRLGLNRIDVILLDLPLPDGHGMEAFDQVFGAAPHIPIIVLGAAGDEETARQITERGARDHLAKSRLDAYWLPRVLRSVIEQETAEDARRTSEARLRAMSDASPLGIFVSDARGHCEYTNAAYQEISGLTADESLGMHWSMAIYPEDRQLALSGWQDAAQDQTLFQCEVRILRQDGAVLWARLNIAALGDGASTPGHVHTVEDITERKQAEEALRAAEETLFEEKERAQVTLNSIGDAVLTTDLHGRVTYLNQVAETLTGWSQEIAVGRPLPEVFKIIDGETGKGAVNPAQRAIEEDRTVGLAIGCVLIRRDGAELIIEDSAAPIHDREGRVSGAVIVFHEASQSRIVTKKMAHLAQHDFLTGLPNRLLLRDRLAQAIGLACRHRRWVGLLYLDLNGFKHINDSLGHEMGDRLLQAVGHRLVACVRATDTVCREGGDEFVILLAELEHPEDANRVADKVHAAFESPLFVDGRGFRVTTSIGISLFPDDSDNAEGLLQKADSAMYQAKASGLGSCRLL